MNGNPNMVATTKISRKVWLISAVAAEGMLDVKKVCDMMFGGPKYCSILAARIW